MTIQIPAYTDDQAYPFWFLRKSLSSFATAGVVNPTTDLIVSPASGLQVQVTAGAAFVTQTVNIEGTSAYNGLYMVVNDATANPFNTITAPVTNPRIDQVILRVYDVKEQRLGGTSKGQIEWNVGSENASASLATMGPGMSNPGVASLPDNSLVLAYVLQPVGVASISSGNILNVPFPSNGSIGRAGLSGAANISASQSTSSSTYTTLTTPDQVTGIVMTTNGLIAVWYQALWQESVSGASRASIFVNSSQVTIANTVNGIDVEAAKTFGGTINVNGQLTSTSFGLACTPAQGGFVGTGQIAGIIAPTSGGQIMFETGSTGNAIYGTVGGPCYIFAAAGTYTISVRFKASSGSVTASNRRLWVQAMPFA